MAGDYTGSRDSVAVIDMQGDTIVTMLSGGRLPMSLTWSPFTDFVYCANAGGDVSVIAGDGSRVLKAVTVGNYPAVLLAVPEYGRVYVGHYGTRLVYVLRDTVSGIEESRKPQAPSPKPTATVVRGVLFLAEASSHKPQAASLLDISGRRVAELRPGPNDVRALAPGIYFCTLDNGSKRISRKVVLTE
jgi:hypothetical protein